MNRLINQITIFTKVLFSLVLRFYFRFNKGIKFQGNLFFNGYPVIDIRSDCNLIIGKNVYINSSNKGYHINMHSPVKLFADRPNAIILIGDNTRIHGSCIHAYNKIEIGNNCLIAANCQIFDGSGHDISLENPSKRINTIGSAKPIIIKDNVWIAANCIIMPGVTIGEGSVIAAGSVVVKNVEPRSLYGGNPAKFIKSIKDQ